jgi:ketosteroid isomerase-like protein
MAFNQRYLKAINEGDFPTLSGLTVDDHIMMVPDRPAIVGKAANDEVNRRVAEQFNVAETWSPIETVIDGKLAYQRGTFSTSVTPKAGGQARTITGKFLRTYRRLPDGSWTMVIDMFNSDSGPARAQ